MDDDVRVPTAPTGHRIPAQSEALGTRYPLSSRSEGTPQVHPLDREQRLTQNLPGRSKLVQARHRDGSAVLGFQGSEVVESGDAFAEVL